MQIFKSLPILAVGASVSTGATRAARAASDDAQDEAAPVLDRQTFQGFYDRTSASLRRYLVRVCDDPAQAEDVFQESYIRLINRGLSFAAGVDLRSYLFRTATNLLRDQWRRRTRERNGLLELFASMRGRSSRPSSDEALDLESALAAMKPRERAMLWLAHVEGYGHRDLATVLDLREGSVRVLLFRLRKRLAQQLDPQRTGNDRKREDES